MKALAVGLGVGLAACKPMMPPPMVAFHGDTAAEPRGTTTAMVVLGVAGQVFSNGVGVAVRVEHQDTTRRTTGVEITGGVDHDLWMIAARGYVRYTPRSHDWVATTAGIGASYTSTGLVSGHLHGGVATSYVNDYVQPFLATGLALAVPLRQPTREWGDKPWQCPGCGPPPLDFQAIPTLETELFWTVDGGAAVPLGDTGNQLSLDLGVALPLRGSQGIFSLSIADRQRVASP